MTRRPRFSRRLPRPTPRIRVITLSRNFGHQAAITAGLDHARGDVAVMIDADLQDPPELMLEMLDRWRDGADVVYGVRRRARGRDAVQARHGALVLRSVRANRAGRPRSSNSGDFRLLDRVALDALGSMRERSRFLRGMTTWVGFEQAAVAYERDRRYAGETKYTLRKMVRFSFDAISSFSHVPLQAATVLGFLFSIVAFLAIPVAIGFRIAGEFVPGVDHGPARRAAARRHPADHGRDHRRVPRARLRRGQAAAALHRSRRARPASGSSRPYLSAGRSFARLKENGSVADSEPMSVPGMVTHLGAVIARPRFALALLGAAVLLLALGTAPFSAANLSATTSNPGNSFTGSTYFGFFASGYYTGNATDNRAIAGVGFKPDVVIVKGNTAQTAAIRTSTMSGDVSKPMAGATAQLADVIQSLDADGFTVGLNARVNSADVGYEWMAFRAQEGLLKVGSYTGNGTSQSVTGLGFSPEYAAVFSAGANNAVQRYSGRDHQLSVRRRHRQRPPDHRSRRRWLHRRAPRTPSTPMARPSTGSPSMTRRASSMSTATPATTPTTATSPASASSPST